uniref:Uncharacterized protein n=1 Tax=Mastacembelus armatus TaxID=205130 RepID=A0A3Q3KJA4_9TELE
MQACGGPYKLLTTILSCCNTFSAKWTNLLRFEYIVCSFCSTFKSQSIYCFVFVLSLASLLEEWFKQICHSAKVKTHVDVLLRCVQLYKLIIAQCTHLLFKLVTILYKLSSCLFIVHIFMYSFCILLYFPFDALFHCDWLIYV